MSRSRDVLERFIETLVQEITVTRPEYLTGPFTVAEIYQDLVPYRSHRALIGVEMNGDYEEALLRMLSGEGDCLLLDSGVARQEIQAELAGPNPNTALFREFAAVDVRLHPGRVPLGAGSGPEVGTSEVSEADTISPEEDSTGSVEVEMEMELEAAGEWKAPEETLQKAAEVGSSGPADPAAATPDEAEPVELLRGEPGSSDEDGVVGHIETISTTPRAAMPPLESFEEPAPDGPVSTDAEPSDVLKVCHWCREALPVRDSVHFCPFCGSDLRPSPCRQCGEAMEATWHFCVSCGADVRG